MVTRNPDFPESTCNMSDIIQTIVFHLNEPPFEFNLRLIEFDSKSPIQLFNLFIDILKTLGFHTDSEFDNYKDDCEVLFHNPTLLESKLFSFFDSIQYPESSNVNFFHRLSIGDKSTLHPLIAHCLTHQESIKQDIYLAKYLAPIEMPMQITMTSNPISSEGQISLMQLIQDYQLLQKEFQDLYMERVELKDDELQYHATDQQLKILCEEEENLQHRIQKQTETLNGGHDLVLIFKTIEAIRKENEASEHLEQKFRQQQKMLEKIQDEWNSYEVTSKNSLNDTPDIRFILDDLHEEVQAALQMVQSDLLPRKSDVENKLNVIEKLLDRSYCSDDDLKDIMSKRSMLSSALKSKIIELQDFQNSKQMSKIQMLRKHLETAMSGTHTKTKEVTNMKDELIELRNEIEKLEKAIDCRIEILNKDCIELPNGCILKTINDRVSFVDEANTMIENAKCTEEKVSYLQKETCLLENTIAMLVQQKSKKYLMLSEKEEQVGAKGYFQTQSHLQATNQEVAKSNELKEDALKEISRSVIELKNVLNNQQSKLQPMMDNLKELRTEYQKIKLNYDTQKRHYNNLVRNVSSEKKSLENTISDLEAKWLDLERSNNSHEYKCIIGDLDIQRLCMEDEKTSGNRIESSASQCLGLQNLYEREIEQQESLCSKLLLEKQELIENEAKLKYHCECFDDIYKLMRIKLEEKTGSLHGNSFGSVNEITVKN